MSTRVDELFEEILALPLEERAWLVRQLLDSLDDEESDESAEPGRASTRCDDED